MPKLQSGHLPPGSRGGDTAISEVDAFDAALRGRFHGASADPMERADQVAHDISEIERAAAALRRAEPALEIWPRACGAGPPPRTACKPRPLWLLIGFVWASTALVTAGAVAAIARLAG